MDDAIDAAERETSFGHGFFDRREILPVLREILATISQRKPLAFETASSLKEMTNIINALPECEPTEFFRLSLRFEARYEDSAGGRTYSISLGPYGLEIDEGGYERTIEGGNEAWSGPHLSVEDDGTTRERGDVEQMLQEMVEAAKNNDYAFTITRDA